jgi:hypothetical protein
MRHLKAVVAGVSVCLAAASTASAEVQFSINDGRVSIVAKDATVREILAEWARIGQTRIVNGERVPGGPITIQLTNVPESEALDVLLESASGYVAAPRPQAVAGISMYDRILVLPTSTAPAVVATRPASFQQPPPFPQPMPFQQPGENDEQERPVPNMMVPGRGPVFSPFPQPQIVNPQTVVTPANGPLDAPQTGSGPQPINGAPAGITNMPTPGPGGGVAVPGMVVPTPQPQPGQIPGQPQQRRPGGGPGGSGPATR